MKKQLKKLISHVNNKGGTMGDIIILLITIFFITIIVHITYAIIKKSKSSVEKIAGVVLIIVIIIMLGIYFLDRYNIPSKLNLTLNVEVQNWLNYITGVISTVIGALVAVCTTVYQIRKNNEANTRRDKDNLRIQNMPILQYNLNTERKGTGDLSELIVTKKEHESGNNYYFNIMIKNIGTNNIKNIIIDFKSPVINNSTNRLLGRDDVNPLEKEKNIDINKYFKLKASEEKYEMLLNIYYQDVLSNWYKQEIIAFYDATNIFEQGEYKSTINFKVRKESIIDEEKIKI